MNIGVIGVEGGWSSERLADAVAAKTGRRLLIGMDRVRLDLPSGRLLFQGEDLSRLDGFLIKKIGSRYSPDLLDRLEILRLIEERGALFFSSPSAILRALDRLSCTITLQLAGIPMPPTTVTEDVDEALDALADYGRAVFKPLYTSKARGMLLLDHGPRARTAVVAYQAENPVRYVQKALDLDGSDLGIAFLGGQYLTTYARSKTNGAWNTTTASGGKYLPFDPPAEIIELARKAQEGFFLDFTTVDVALTKDGPFVFEVSAFGGFRGLLDARGLDAAALLADYALKRISR